MKKLLKTTGSFVSNKRLPIMLSAVGIVAVIAGYMMSTKYPGGMLSYIAGAPALTGIVLTSLAKVNDISSKNTSLRWQLRRIGLTMAGAASVAYLYAPFSEYPAYPTWLAVALFWGVFATLYTTRLIYLGPDTGGFRAFNLRANKLAEEHKND